MAHLPVFKQHCFVYAVLCTVFLLSVIACSKSSDPSVTPTNGIVISGIDPATGTAGTVVTINGGGFSATPTDNKVKFNGVDALVQTASATKLTVVAPVAGQTGPITVQNGSQTTSGPTFTYSVANEPVVTTYAGSGVQGFAEGTLKTAQFDKPYSIAVDVQGNLYVTEYVGSRIRKIAPDGTVSTLAGSGVAGYKDGKGTVAQFRNPGKMVCDPQGNLYVIDDGSRIRKVTPAGDVTSVAGTSSCGFVDGPAASALFCGLGGIAISSTGDLYVCDSNNNRVRKISGGQVTTVAGSKEGYADGSGNVALFKSPNALTIDSKDNLYVGQTNLLRKITPSGVVSTFVGSNTGFSGPVEGTGAAVILGEPFGLVSDASDNLYVADFQYSLIWKITPSAVATIVTGAGSGYKEGGRLAQFRSPADIRRDSKGNLYVADYNNHVIRQITLK